ncbi:MAG: hypothetical protein MI743_12405 [Sneathiellales bacterium]|nr:hypothetical protein [Sneathiellales bacterium]
MMTFKLLAASVALATAFNLVGNAQAAGGAKETFERTKPHMKVSPTPQKPERKKAGKPNRAVGGFKPKPFVDLYPAAKFPAGPFPGAPNSGFCGTNNGGAAKYILVGAKNNGTKAGGQFINRVTFPNALPSERVIEDPYIDSGPGFGTSYIAFPIPASAWKNGKAKYVIKVDSKLDVKETNEGNNIATGYCKAPAT